MHGPTFTYVVASTHLYCVDIYRELKGMLTFLLLTLRNNKYAFIL